MTMRKHLNVLVSEELLEALNIRAALHGLNRSATTRMLLARALYGPEVYSPPTLPNWQVEAWTSLLRSLFGDERLALTAEVKPLLAEALAKLDERSARVLGLRFGLDGPRHTLEEVGAIFGVKRSRAHQVEARALRRMRYWLRNSGIWELLEEQLNKKEKANDAKRSTCNSGRRSVDARDAARCIVRRDRGTARRADH